MNELNHLLQSLPGYSTLSHDMKQAALDRSLVPDTNGVWPGQPGYETTYDVYFAAHSLVGFLRSQPVVTSAGSEGTTVSVTAPEWDALLTFYSGQSSILSYGQQVLTRIPIPDPPHVFRTNMHGGGDSDDIDTDLS